MKRRDFGKALVGINALINAANSEVS